MWCCDRSIWRLLLTERNLICPKATELATVVEAVVNNLQDLHVEPTRRMQSQLKAIELRKGTFEIEELILCLFLNLKWSSIITAIA